MALYGENRTIFTRMEEEELAQELYLWKVYKVYNARAVHPDPHSFSLLDPDPYSICGSRKEKRTNNKRKNERKLVIIIILKKIYK